MNDTNLNRQVQDGEKELCIFGFQVSLLLLVEIYVILCIPSQAEPRRQIINDDPGLTEPFSVGQLQGGRPKVLGDTSSFWVGDIGYQGRVILGLVVGCPGVLEDESDVFASPWNTVPLRFSKGNQSMSRSGPGSNRQIRRSR